jgi:hypothetical protein
MICSKCDDKVPKAMARYGDRGTPFEGKPLCEPCYEQSSPGAIVFYGHSDDGCVITDTRNATNGDFRLRWRSTSPVSGFYETESDSYEKLSSSHLLAEHESLGMLKSMDDRIKELYDREGLQYARVITMSSNPYVHDYHVFVENDQVPLGKDLVQKAKEVVDYDNPKWYRNILFSEDQFNLLAELFPEREIRTDYDAAKVVDEYGENITSEIDRRMKLKPPAILGGLYIV